MENYDKLKRLNYPLYREVIAQASTVIMRGQFKDTLKQAAIVEESMVNLAIYILEHHGLTTGKYEPIQDIKISG